MSVVFDIVVVFSNIEGPDVSKQFRLKDGQRLRLSFHGNIGTRSGEDGEVRFYK